MRPFDRTFPLALISPKFELVGLNISRKYRLYLRSGLITVAVLLLATATFSFFRIKNEAFNKLAQTRARSESEAVIPFTKSARSVLDKQQIQIWQSTNNVRAVSRFHNSVFAATDGGLLQIADDGRLVRHYTVLDGLTESDLTCLAVFEDQLFIGTRSSGLLAFDGTRFDSYAWRDREAKSVNALLPDGGRLLIGTFAGGLIEFDGSQFRERTAINGQISSINFLAKDNQKLFVGTFDDGLWLEEAGGNWRHFTTAQGLLSNRVISVIPNGENVLVGTDLGVSETVNIQQTDGKLFHTVAALPTLSSLVRSGDEILATKDDGQIFALVGEKNNSLSPLPVIGSSPDLTGARLVISEKDCWLIGSQGIFRREQHSFRRFAGALTENQLASNTISALGVDAKDQIWAGTFRQGIDVFEPRGHRITHLETEREREINFILPEKEAVWAATSQGTARFDKLFHVFNVSKTEGLLSNSVSHISFGGDESRQQFFATSRGLSFHTNNGWRGLTTVNGLPSNNVFTTIFYRNSLFIGTLGGLAETQNGRVIHTFTDANSKLSHNWITSLCAAEGRLFVGTYGGGVFELTAAGELRPFAPEIGKFIVNPNAMLTDGERLYVGTLSGAWILDLTTQKWIHLTDELPAQTVLSGAGDSENIYLGTTGGIAKINKNYFRSQK